MADPKQKNPSLRDFDAYVDVNGQNMGQTDATEIADPARLKKHLESDVGAEAEMARLASGHRNEDATDATEAEIAPETIALISDPTVKAKP
jgi:hypothetical protein